MVPKVCFIPSDPQAIRDLTYFCKEFQTIRCDRRPSELLSALFEYRVTSINCTKNRKMFSTSLKKYHLRKLQLFLLSDLAYKNEFFFEFNHLKKIALQSRETKAKWMCQEQVLAQSLLFSLHK